MTTTIFDFQANMTVYRTPPPSESRTKTVNISIMLFLIYHKIFYLDKRQRKPMKAIKNGRSRDKGNIRHKKRRTKTNITQITKKMSYTELTETIFSQILSDFTILLSQKLTLFNFSACFKIKSRLPQVLVLLIIVLICLVHVQNPC